MNEINEFENRIHNIQNEVTKTCNNYDALTLQLAQKDDKIEKLEQELRGYREFMKNNDKQQKAIKALKHKQRCVKQITGNQQKLNNCMFC